MQTQASFQNSWWKQEIMFSSDYICFLCEFLRNHHRNVKRKFLKDLRRKGCMVNLLGKYSIFLEVLSVPSRFKLSLV